MIHRVASRAGVIAGTIAICAGLALVASCAPARSHDWYPLACCNTADCYVIGEAGSREPAPTYTPQGWRMHDGGVVPFSRARVSPDGKFHVCRRDANPANPIIHPTNEPPCLWAPGFGS